MSPGSPLSPSGSHEPGLTVRVRFKLADEPAARELAAKVIERAHELANLPESECDVDVDVEWIGPPEQPHGLSSSHPAPDPHSDL
ncbi:MAG: hypothetical protein ACRDK4_14770 [Solirubrobacteraceae bacterium]